MSDRADALGAALSAALRWSWVALVRKVVTRGNLPYNWWQIATGGGPVPKAAVADTLNPQPRVLKRVQEILNTPRLRSDQDLVQLVEGRLPTDAIDGLRHSGLTDDEVYALVVPRRTLTHRRARREALSRDESDRAVRIARTAALAEQVFGDVERAWRWLRASKRQFRGRSPLQLLATEAGARLVEEVLYRVDEGMAAQVVLWRISNHVSLTGDGGLRASGRWHTRGKRIIYCAENPAAALLEILVHFEIEIRDLPARYRLLKINVQDDLHVERVSPNDLPVDWLENTQVTRAIGDAWLTQSAAPLLAVPSAIVPETWNVLLNPAHSDAKRIVIVHTSDHVIDPRLLS